MTLSLITWQHLAAVGGALVAATIIAKFLWAIASFFIELKEAVKKLTASVAVLVAELRDYAVQKQDHETRISVLEAGTVERREHERRTGEP